MAFNNIEGGINARERLKRLLGSVCSALNTIDDYPTNLKPSEACFLEPHALQCQPFPCECRTSRHTHSNVPIEPLLVR